MGIRHITAGDKAPEVVNVIIEIPANGNPVKYEVDKDSGALIVDRFLQTAMRYPCNYGYVPQTLSEDGDPVDVLVITPSPLISGCVIEARPVAMLGMEDEKGIDAKILAVPADSLSPFYQDVQGVKDITPQLISTIEHFFQHYKDLEPNKWTKIHGWQGVEDAYAEIRNSIKRYETTK